MTNRPRALLAWSTGKDSAWALHVLRSRADVEVVGLVTTVNEAPGRVASHGVPLPLLEAQARAAGLPLWTAPIPSPCPNHEYERAMALVNARALAEGIEAIAFGDLFLADIRRYREDQLRGSGLRPIFPLWDLPTGPLAAEMVASGLRAKIICVDPAAAPRALLGRDFDAALLAELPATVDPCGERGEFHTFAFAGPMFAHPIDVATGAVTERDGLVFVELRAPDAAA